MDILIRQVKDDEITETAFIYIECHQVDFPFLPEAHRRHFDLAQEAAECVEWLASEPVNRLYVAKQFGKMLGYIALGRNTLDPVDYEGEVTGFFVRKAYRQKGLGLRLLEAGSRHLLQAGYAKTLVYTLNLADSARFYRSIGGVLLKQMTQRFGGEPFTVDIYGWQTADLLAEVSQRLQKFAQT
jgi:ribosomal protein S18 acetylase RimI-like enzyme